MIGPVEPACTEHPRELEQGGPDPGSMGAVGRAGVEAWSFRNATSMFATGVAVATCEDVDGQFHGITVNSFALLGMAPPTVLIAMRAGRVHRIVSRKGKYGLCILMRQQAAIFAHFGGRPQQSLHVDFIVRDSLPTLRKCLAWFECSVVQQVQVHDQTLFIAQVTSCGSERGEPLVLYDGGFLVPGGES